MPEEHASEQLPTHDENPAHLSDHLDLCEEPVFTHTSFFTLITSDYLPRDHKIGVINAAHALCHKLGLIAEGTFSNPTDHTAGRHEKLLADNSHAVPSNAEFHAAVKDAAAVAKAASAGMPSSPTFGTSTPTITSTTNPFDYGDTKRYALVPEEFV